jgi:DNA repair exonuclease SbcCD nuclease subunit
MKLLHLSDTHVGHSDNLVRLERLIGDIIANPPDLPERCCVLHTGDLIDSASPAHRQAGKGVLDRLRQQGFRVFLCPGNHDYGNAMGIASAAARDFREYFADYIFAGQMPEFPVVHLLDERNALLLLDSNQAEIGFWKGLFAEGNLGREQLQKLNEMLDRPEIRSRQVILGVHHHPFSYAYKVTPDVGDGHLLHHLVVGLTSAFRRLKDAHSLCETIRARVRVLLFGHRHFGLNCSSDSQSYDIPLALDGGSSTCTDRNSDRMRYRVIDLDTLMIETRTLRV